jgi:hypothetical protein
MYIYQTYDIIIDTINGKTDMKPYFSTSDEYSYVVKNNITRSAD